MFARMQFSLIFANSLPRKNKVLANKELQIALQTARVFVCESKDSLIIRKSKICAIEVMRKFSNLQYCVLHGYVFVMKKLTCTNSPLVSLNPRTLT